MHVGVLGTGMVGKTIAAKLGEIGETVVVGTRDPGKLRDWLGQVERDVTAGSFAQAAALADGDHHVFVSGDDAQAKAQVCDLLRK